MGGQAMSERLKGYIGDPQIWIVLLLFSLVGINVPDLIDGVTKPREDPALAEKLERLKLFEKLEDQARWKEEVITEMEVSFSTSLRNALTPLTNEVAQIRETIEKGERWSLEDMANYHEAHLAGASPTPREIQIKRLGEEASRTRSK